MRNFEDFLKFCGNNNDFFFIFNRYLDYKKLGIRTYSLSQYQEAIADLKSGSISKAMFKIE